jgi:hypothetical protein
MPNSPGHPLPSDYIVVRKDEWRELERLRVVAKEALRVVTKKGHGDTALWDALHEVFPEEVPAGD